MALGDAGVRPVRDMVSEIVGVLTAGELKVHWAEGSGRSLGHQFSQQNCSSCSRLSPDSRPPEVTVCFCGR